MRSQSVPDLESQKALHPKDNPVIQMPNAFTEIPNPFSEGIPNSFTREINIDDIRFIDSDIRSIRPKIPTDKSQTEPFADKYPASLFVQRGELHSLHETALQNIERRRFTENYGRILKSYYRRLPHEAFNETEKGVTKVLRSRRNRENIAEGIADHLRFEEKEIVPFSHLHTQPIGERLFENWLKRMQDLDYEKLSEAREEPFVDDYQPQNGDSDNEIYSDSEPDASDDFSNIHRAERFLHQGSAFRNLVLGIRLLILPHRLRQIIETTPKNSVALISYNDIGWINNIKSRLETYTGYVWDWWPLAPRIPNLAIGEQHLQWEVRLPDFTRNIAR